MELDFLGDSKHLWFISNLATAEVYSTQRSLYCLFIKRFSLWFPFAQNCSHLKCRSRSSSSLDTLTHKYIIHFGDTCRVYGAVRQSDERITLLSNIYSTQEPIQYLIEENSGGASSCLCNIRLSSYYKCSSIQYDSMCVPNDDDEGDCFSSHGRIHPSGSDISAQIVITPLLVLFLFEGSTPAGT